MRMLRDVVALSDMLLRNRCNLGCTGAEAKVIGNKSRALMAELADALDLGSNGRPCGFESH